MLQYSYVFGNSILKEKKMNNIDKMVDLVDFIENRIDEDPMMVKNLREILEDIRKDWNFIPDASYSDAQCVAWELLKATLTKPKNNDGPPTIKSCTFEKTRGLTSVIATLSNGDAEKAFDFYDDELSFTERELCGFTLEEAGEYYHKKDVEYLQS
jgi:hypothetical protein